MKLLLERWNKFLTEQQGRRLSIFDFDDTIAASKSRTIATNQKTGESFRVANQAQQDALQAKGGYDFDFSEFDIIIDPEEITPIMKKMRKRLAEPNTQVMILTARAPVAEDDIQNYLNTLDKPIDTGKIIIVGLDGANKGSYVLTFLGAAPDFADVEFHDDSLKNIQHMVQARGIVGDKLNSFDIYHVDDGVIKPVVD